MRTRLPLSITCLGIAAVLAGCERPDSTQTPAAEAAAAPVDAVSYAEDVAPILQKHCAECHLPGLPGAEATGFLVDSYASVMDGSQYGPVIKPGQADTSSLYILLSADDHITVHMPHGREPLSAEEIGTIRTWIDSGAPDN
jgi:hypothetical protein